MIEQRPISLDLAGLRTFVEALQVMAWVLDEHGEPLFGNAIREQFAPFNDASNSLYDILHPDDAEAVRVVRERAFATGREVSYDARFRRIDGTFVEERVSLSPVNVGGRRYWFGVAYEISTLLRERRSTDLYHARYQQLIEHSSIGVMSIDLHSNAVLHANDALLRMLGFSLDELTSLPPGSLTPPEWTAVTLQANEAAVSSGILPQFEKEFITKSGSRIAVIVTGVVRAGSSDEALCFVVDITSQKAMRQALSASEARYASLAELVPVIISISTSSGHWANAAWEAYSGMEGGCDFEQRFSIVHPEDADAYRSALTNPEGEFELRLRRFDGEYRWFFVRWKTEALDDAQTMRIATAVDIHDSHVLRAQRDGELLRIADSLPSLVWSVRSDGVQDYTNAAWDRYCGKTPPVRADVAWSTVLHPDDAELFRLRWQHCFETGDVFEFELRIRSKDFGYRWFLIRAMPLREDGGAIARWFGTATDIEDHKRALTAAAAGERRYRDLAEAMPQIVWTSSPWGSVDYVNGRWAEFTGSSPEAAHGDGWLEAVPQEDRAKVSAQFREALSTAAPFSIDLRLHHARSRNRWVVMRARPEFGVDGSVERWIGTFTDVDNERRIAEEQAYLAEASRLLGSSLDIDETLAQVAALAVPVLGDWCEIDLLQEDGTFKTAAVAHYDAEKHRALQGLIGRIAPEAHPRLSPAVNDLETRIYHEVTPQDVAQSGYGTDYAAVYALAGLSSTMVVPLIAGNEPLGAISYVSSAPDRGFTDADQRFGEELARRAALSIQNAQLYSREHRVADAMQSASLPKELPDVPAVEMSAIYVPGHSEAQIGGDWFDAFRLRDGRLVLSIGDVAGSGLDAAVTMSNMRQIIRGTAQVHADPVLMLNAADRALRLEEPDRFVTAFVGVLDPITRSLTYASAGHHPPYVRHRDGRLEELEFSDLPLGLRHRSTANPRTFDIPDNAILIMYTDGLIESERDIEGGVAALEAVLATTEFGDIDYPAEYLREQLLSSGARDDVAILTLRFLPEELVDPLVYRWRYEDLDAESMAHARQLLRETLLARDFRSMQIEAAQVVLGELAGNVVRHAPGPIEIVLDFTGPAAVLHVLDEGPGFERAPMLPADVLSESGRGLYIVSELAELLSVSRRPHRGSHARAVLVGRR